ncbi:MAG TPA: hypothetical protein PKE30_10945 [Niabella sp.]|nr:hypothetical protein [Niabella sp.]
MKKILPTVLLLLLFAACQKKDIRELRDELNEQKNLIAQLQSAIGMANTDIQNIKGAYPGPAK